MRALSRSNAVYCRYSSLPDLVLTAWIQTETTELRSLESILFSFTLDFGCIWNITFLIEIIFRGDGTLHFNLEEIEIDILLFKLLFGIA